jgi:hypothetical protein
MVDNVQNCNSYVGCSHTLLLVCPINKSHRDFNQGSTVFGLRPHLILHPLCLYNCSECVLLHKMPVQFSIRSKNGDRI